MLKPDKIRKLNTGSRNALLSFMIVARNYKADFLIMGILSVGIVVLNISTTLFFNHLIDNIIPQKLSNQLIGIAVLLVFMHMWVTLLDIIRAKIVAVLAKTMNNDIMYRYVYKTLHIQ